MANSPYDPVAGRANFIQVLVTNWDIRIAFGEGDTGPPSVRYFTAVTMSPPDARTLAKTILSALDQHHAKKEPPLQPDDGEKDTAK